MDKIYFDKDIDFLTVKRAYEENGVVVIRKLIDEARLKEFHRVARQVIYSRAESAGVALPDGLDIDAAFNRLCSVNRALGGNVYDCLRHHPEAVKGIADPLTIKYLEILLGTENVYYAIDQIQFRIDRRHEERFALPWHQDYWWNNLSKNGITIWYPIVDIPFELGPIRFLLGSHKELAKIRVNPDYKTKWDQYRLFELAKPVDETRGVDVPVHAGDVVFINHLVLHRSGYNLSDRSRWTVISRYADMFAPEFVAKGWKSGIRVGYLSILETDPDCVVNLDEVSQASDPIAIPQ